MAAPVVVILAAGKGTRMRSKTPKLLHSVCGREMIWWTVTAAREAGAAKIVVVDSAEQPLHAHLDADVQVAIQQAALGTGDAAKAAAQFIDSDATVIILTGDAPLIRAQTISRLAAFHERSGSAATVLTSIFDDPSGYGRVVRDAQGDVIKVVETKAEGDATAEELAINEINTGIYAFDGGALLAALDQVSSDNAQGEYYLPDVLGILREAGDSVAATALASAEETMGVNDRVQLQAVVAVAQRRILEHHMLAGATIVSPQTTVIDIDVKLGQDVIINPGSGLHGSTTISDGAIIGPHTTLTNVIVGQGSSVVESYGSGAEIGAHVNVGPFSFLRPGTVLGDESKAGAFVELKNTQVGERSKVPHLSYVGDTDIGQDSNLGASTITANYDGYVKHRTKVGSRVHTSVHTTLVAPIELGDDSYTAAGSALTKDVPDGALGVARPRQTNIEGYAEKVRERRPEADDS